MRSTIICVDDDRWLLEVLSDLLEKWLGKNYTVEKAMSAPEAIDIISECIASGDEISLVIADYIMPGMKGDELLEKVKDMTPSTRRIMLTGFAAIEGITNAINKAGIYRFMSKPWDNKDLMLTVLQAIRSYEQDKHAEKVAKSHKELFQRFQELANSLQAKLDKAVESLSSASEMRGGAAGHCSRVAASCDRVATELRLQNDDVKLLDMGAMLHDVGRLGMSDAELAAVSGTKAYSDNDVCKKQSELAVSLLSGFDERVVAAVKYVFERPDGTGPYGLTGADIPLEAKIIGICDRFDSLSAESPDTSTGDILRGMSPDNGKAFDERVFLALLKAYKQV